MLGRKGHPIAPALSDLTDDRDASRSSLRRFVAAVASSRRRQLACVVAVQLANALAQASSVLLLVPLLSAIGVHSSGALEHRINRVLEAVGITPTLGALLAVYVGVTVAIQVLSIFQGVLSTRFRLDFINDLRCDTYAAVGGAEWRHLIGMRRADLLAALTSNVPLVGNGVAALLGLVVSVVVVVAQLSAAIQVSAISTALAVASGFALVWVVWPLARRSRRLGAEMVVFNRAAMRAATAFLDALKLVKAYGREEAQEREYMTAVSRARNAQVSLAWANTLANGAQSSLSALLLAITVYVAIRVAHVPSGSLLVVAVVFTKIVGQITSSQSNIQSVAQALPAFEEIEELLRSCMAAHEGRGARRRIGIGTGIELQDVRFSYPSTRGDRAEALRGVSLELPTGSTLALAGPSGAGKTTVADLVAGLMVPSSGRVCVGGQELTRERLAGWRQAIALVPQEPFMFHDTIAANLRFARSEATDRELWEALRVANVAEFVAALPEGLETIVGDQGLRLSGGERQRLALARALLRQPDLLILDEATSSLDTENELAIRVALSELHGRTTMLLIAHRLSTVSEADRIAVLDGGQVVETGSWSELAGREAGRLQSLIAAGATPPVGGMAAL
jgi:ATP-binding cassette subfamily C protein